MRPIRNVVKKILDKRLLELLNEELKNENTMTEDDLPKHDIDYLMNASYESLTENFDRTSEIFIVFEDGDTVIEVPAGKGHRSRAIDKIMNYFIEQEDYEKCVVLRDLKTKIIQLGD